MKKRKFKNIDEILDYYNENKISKEELKYYLLNFNTTVIKEGINEYSQLYGILGMSDAELIADLEEQRKWKKKKGL
jgi:hypothetical protein